MSESEIIKNEQKETTDEVKPKSSGEKESDPITKEEEINPISMSE